MDTLTERIARLSPAKRAAWLKLVEGQRADRGALAAPPVAGEPREGPLSFAQERLLFLDELRPGCAAYNLTAALRLRGALDRDALARAVSDVTAAHEALRTVFAGDGAGAVQRVTDAKPAWEVRAVEGEREALALARTAAERPFDLARGPMLRASLFAVAPDDHVLVVVTHHIVADGSLGILLEELVAAYAARAAGGAPAPRRDGEPRFVDFCRWQRDPLRAPALDAHAAYFQRALEGHSGAIHWPAERPRPARQSSRGARASFAVAPPVVAGLRALGAAHGATLFMTGLAVFVALLRRWSGQDDHVVGTPIADRPLSALKRSVGSFVNVLPLRVRAEPDAPFAALLAGARDAALGAFDHKDVPFERIVDAVRPQRDLSRTPLFQAMFVLEERAPSSPRLAGLDVEPIDVDPKTSRFDVLLGLREEGDGLEGVVEYCTDLFDAGDVARMIRHFQRLAASAAEDPSRPVSRLAMLGDDERRHWLVDWNGPTSPAPSRLLNAPFEEQARARPGATAVVAPGRSISYGELARASRRIGAALRARGVAPNDVVAIVMEKGWEQVVAALGVLASGGAYLPVDPRLPADRVAYMLERAAVRVALTQPRVADRVAWPGAVERIAVDDGALAGPGDGEEVAPLAPAPRPEDLAYVIFTSGSTGLPKGVMIEHAAALNTVLDVNARFGWCADDRVLALSSLSFDLSVQDVFGTLAAGGAIVIPAADRAREPSHWAELVEREGVTVWSSVPALLQMFVEHAGSRAAPPRSSLRLAMLSGDWVPLALPDAARALAPSMDVVALGGATEASIWSIYHRVGAIDPAWASVPYGRPLANQTLYVLDDALEPCPLGVAGQIHIGGAGLARGYLGDEERTARSFFVHPRTGERLYATGDLGRQRRAGFIELLGRVDLQVKIRGYRVELGEIEAVLSAHPSVREIVVVARADGGDKRLVAYVVPAADGDLDVEGLRALARSKLPEYMEPAAFVRVGALPLSANGKVDRAALPAPGPSSCDRPAAIAPRGPTERAIARIYGDLLGAASVSALDDFFALGGTSLLAVRLLSRVQQATGAAVALATLFERPTVAGLAQAIDASAAGAEVLGARPRSPLVTLRESGVGPPVFFVHPAGGGALCYRALAAALGRPFHALQADGVDGARPPRASVEEMAAAYVEAVRAAWPEGPYVIGGWSVGGVIAFEVASRLRAGGADVALLALVDAHAGEGPLDAAASRALFVSDLERLLGARVDAPADLDDVDALAEAVRASGAFGGDVTLARARGLLDVFVANVRSAARYRPRAYAGRVAVARAAESTAPSDLGWGDALAFADVTSFVAPGDHYAMMEPPLVGALAAHLGAAIDAALAAQGGGR